MAKTITEGNGVNTQTKTKSEGKTMNSKQTEVKNEKNTVSEKQVETKNEKSVANEKQAEVKKEQNVVNEKPEQAVQVEETTSGLGGFTSEIKAEWTSMTDELKGEYEEIMAEFEEEKQEMQAGTEANFELTQREELITHVGSISAGAVLVAAGTVMLVKARKAIDVGKKKIIGWSLAGVGVAVIATHLVQMFW